MKYGDGKIVKLVLSFERTSEMLFPNEREKSEKRISPQKYGNVSLLSTLHPLCPWNTRHIDGDSEENLIIVMKQIWEDWEEHQGTGQSCFTSLYR